MKAMMHLALPRSKICKDYGWSKKFIRPSFSYTYTGTLVARNTPQLTAAAIINVHNLQHFKLILHKWNF
jgi:hypothetical protein